MPKFSALSLTDLMSDARNAGRVARKTVYAVCVEADDGSWFELDGSCFAHAQALANSQVDKMSARGASCWTVNHLTGELDKGPAMYTVYAE